MARQLPPEWQMKLAIIGSLTIMLSWRGHFDRGDSESQPSQNFPKAVLLAAVYNMRLTF